MDNTEEKSREYPAVTLRSMTVLPGMLAQFEVSRDKSVYALEEALRTEGEVLLITQKSAEREAQDKTELYENGTIAAVRTLTRTGHGLTRVTVSGLRPARLIALRSTQDCLYAQVQPHDLPEERSEDPEQLAMMRGLKDLFARYTSATGKVQADAAARAAQKQTLPAAAMEIAAQLRIEYIERQGLLDTEDLMERCENLCVIMSREIAAAQVLSDIQSRVKARLDKNQKEYILREQLKVISEQLGESLPVSEAQQFLEKTEQLCASDEVKAKIRTEIARFRTLSGSSAEASVSRGYIETLLAMPWDKATKDNQDLKHAARVLDEDHYGMEKVKERVLEYLAVRILNGKGDSPILCLAGAPGTGKTSVARSVARALDKQYVRIGLGGVRDEAEIRGHRRTYIGAMPGRIAAALKSSGVSNPLILLDEVDKLGASYNGDPSAALLEVLDAQQNSHFTDHYIDMPLDLSGVMFIATANDLSAVPRPLLDRMEVIELESYTDTEKYHIATEHLLPRQRGHHGLKKNQLQISRKGMEAVISGYTREAGVRSLERQIGRICRKAARQILEQGQAQVRVKAGNLEDYLGRRKYDRSREDKENEIGLVNGLAWTSVGGVVLEVETIALSGKGEVRLTGQLGDVMKESAAAALSYVRSAAGEYGVADDWFSTHDFHLHIPDGAVPKDGPSAGITMATAILSAAAKIPVRADTAMTGEVTLRGAVLPIGGLKEKILAAKKTGISRVLVPEKNKPEVRELPEEITDGMHILYVKHMKQVFQEALCLDKEGEVR